MAYSSYSKKRDLFSNSALQVSFQIKKKKDEFSIVVPKLIHFKSISVYASLTVNSVF